MKRYVIEDAGDVRDFFFDLYMRTGKAFLPEEDLAELEHQDGTPVFSKPEVEYLDDIVLDCFVFCNDNHLDIDEIAEAVQHEFGFALQRVPNGAVRNVFPAFR